MKKILIKGQEYYFDFIVKDNYNEIKAYDIKKREIGHLTMFVTKEIFPRSIWLMHIFVNEDARYCGVGQKMLDALEYFARKCCVEVVEGKFYPDNAYAKDFYEKNGYEIWKDGYETYVSKNFSHLKKKDKKMQDNELDELFK